jgi:hypothetical protein
MAIAACTRSKQHNTVANQQQNLVNDSNQLTATLMLPQALTAPTQVFTIAANSSQIITAKEGLRVHINTNHFEAVDGSPISGPVGLTIKELVTHQALVTSDCPTVSNGKLLETAGSYFIDVRSGGKKLQLKSGKKMQVEFPRRGDNMELFYGQRNADGTMNWLPLQQKLLRGAVESNAPSPQAIAFLKGVQSDLPAKPVRPDAGSAATAGRYFTPQNWFKAYHDTLVQHRRNIIRKNFKQMTQPQIRAVMEAPYKMAATDLANIKDLRIHRICENQSQTYRFNNFDLYVHKLPGADSVVYAIDSFWFVQQARIAAAEQLEMAVDNIGEIPFQKKGKILTAPGSTNVKVSYYQPVELAQLGWINCDRFYNYPDGITPEYTIDIKGKVPATLGVYIIYKNINSVTSDKINTNGKSSNTIKAQLPLQAKVDFLVYTKIDNKFYQCKQTATVTKNMVISVELKPVPPGQVREFFLN